MWICWKWGTWGRMGYHGNILFRTNGGRRGRDRKPNSVWGEWKGRARKPNFVAYNALIVSGWVVVVWGTESYSGLTGNTYFVYMALRMSALGMGQTVRLGKRNTLCCKSRKEICFYLVLWFLIFYLLFIIFYVLNFFRIAKWWWLPWVSAVGLVEESPTVPLREDEEGWGGWWQGTGQCHWGCAESRWERDVESHEGCDCFKIQEINNQTQMKWFLFSFLKKEIIWIDKLKFKNISIILF